MTPPTLKTVHTQCAAPIYITTTPSGGNVSGFIEDLSNYMAKQTQSTNYEPSTPNSFEKTNPIVRRQTKTGIPQETPDNKSGVIESIAQGETKKQTQLQAGKK